MGLGTAAAVMVAVAAIGSVGALRQAWLDPAAARSPADVVAVPSDVGADIRFSPAEAERLAHLEEVVASFGSRSVDVTVDGRPATLFGVTASFFDSPWSTFAGGRAPVAAEGEVAVPVQSKWRLGQRIRVRGATQSELLVVGRVIVRGNAAASHLYSTLDALPAPAPGVSSIAVDLDERTQVDAWIASHRATVPFAELRAPSLYRAASSKIVRGVVIALWMAVALIVAVAVATIFTLVELTLQSRRSAYRIVAVVGGSARQLLWVVAIDGVVTALVGAAVGIPLGVVLAPMLTRIASDAAGLPLVPTPLRPGVLVAAAIAALLIAVCTCAAAMVSHGSPHRWAIGSSRRAFRLDRRWRGPAAVVAIVGLAAVAASVRLLGGGSVSTRLLQTSCVIAGTALVAAVSTPLVGRVAVALGSRWSAPVELGATSLRAGRRARRAMALLAVATASLLATTILRTSLVTASDRDWRHVPGMVVLGAPAERISGILGRLRATPHVSAAASFASATITGGGDRVIWIVEPATFGDVSWFRSASGEALQLSALDQAGVVFVSDVVARTMDVDVGDRWSPEAGREALAVGGVYRTGFGPDALVGERTGAALVGTVPETQVIVRVDAPEKAAHVRDQIVAREGRRDVAASTTQQLRAESRSDVVRAIDAQTLLLVIVAAVGLVGVAAVFVANVLEHRYRLAVESLLGASPRLRIKAVVAEALLVGVGAVVVALPACGVLAGLMLDAIGESNASGYRPDLVASPSGMALTAVVCLVAITAVSIVPARLAASVSPREALALREA